MCYAKQFWEEFHQEITNELAENENFMNTYKIGSEYTHKMNNLEDGIIYNTIKNIDLNMKCQNRCDDFASKMRLQNEYLRVDVTAWKSIFDENSVSKEKADWKEKFKKCGMTPHLWDLYFAVEHENDSKDWIDEVLKLAHLRCPLKVVIGYVPCDRRNDADYGDIARLKLVAKCLKWTDAYRRQPDTYSNHSDGAGCEELLVILGNCSGIEDTDYNSPDYKGYLFDNTQGFKKLDIETASCNVGR